MKKDLPIFDIIINEEDLAQGVGMISLVDEPAIGVNWIALKKQPNMLMATRECLGCPPNGDGTKANGEPDGRCKGDGTGKAGKGAGKSTGKASPKVKEEPVAKSTGPINPSEVPTSVLSLAPTDKWSDEQKAFWGDENNIKAVQEKNQELENRKAEQTQRIKNYNADVEAYNRDKLGYKTPQERSDLNAFAEELKMDRRFIEQERNDIAAEEQKMARINSVVEETGNNPFAGTTKGDRIDEDKKREAAAKADAEERIANDKRVREEAKRKEAEAKAEKQRIKDERDARVTRGVVSEIQDEIREKGYADFNEDEYQNLIDFKNSIPKERSSSGRFFTNETITEKYPIVTDAKQLSNAGSYWASTYKEPGKHIYASETTYKRDGMFSSNSYGSSIAKITRVDGKERIEPTEYGKSSGEFNKLMELWRSSKKSSR